jgi:hypothetical protein
MAGGHLVKENCHSPETRFFGRLGFMSELPPPPILPASVDRRTGLAGFGVFAIVLGAICALMSPFLALSQIAVARRTGHPPDWSLIAFPTAMYLVAAAILITLGIGSIRTRRWARALMLCLAWMGLIGGAFTLCLAIWVATKMKLPQTGRGGAAAHEAAMIMIKVVMIGTMTVILVLLPALFVWFYSRPGVKSTCEAGNPEPSWTDRCPLPVLAAGLFIGLSAVAGLLAVGWSGVFPIGTLVLRGLPARIFWFVSLCFGIYAARGFYRLDLRAWTLYFIVFILQAISNSYGYWQGTWENLYRHSAASGQQPGSQPPFPLDHHVLIGIVMALGLPWIGYVVYLRRYFPNRPKGLA